MSVIYLIETNNQTVLSQGIRLFSRYPYNHISISLDSSLTEVYSFGRRQPYNPLMAGFAKEDFSHSFYKESSGRVYALQVSEQEKRVIHTHLQLFESYPLEWHYNLLGLLPAYFQYSWERPDHFFCSEFVATLLQSAGVLSPLNRPNLMHPRDIIQAVHPTCVYDGPLQLYPELIPVRSISNKKSAKHHYLNPIHFVYRQLNH